MIFLLLLVYDELMYSLTLSHRKEINKKFKRTKVIYKINLRIIQDLCQIDVIFHKLLHYQK